MRRDPADIGPQRLAARRGGGLGDREADAERVYSVLSNGGEIFMKMEKTPFANRFAMLRDKFGTSWMLLHQPAADAKR